MVTMKPRIFDTLSLISAILLACTIILWPWSFWAEPGKDYLSFTDEFHVGVYRGRLDLFNSEYPYHGSIIAITSLERPIERIFSERRAFGDTVGIYYRYFCWADSGAVLWTLSVSLLYPLIVFAVLPTIWGWKWWRVRSFCPNAQKDLGLDRKCCWLSVCIAGWASWERWRIRWPDVLAFVSTPGFGAGSHPRKVWWQSRFTARL